MLLKYITIFIILTLTLFSYQGEGNGKNRQEAIYHALSDIASQISVSVNSSTTINKRATKEDYNREIKNMISIEIPKISFQNYHIIEESQKGTNYFVKLEIDRKILADTHTKKLEQKLNSLSQKINAYTSKWKRYTILKKIEIDELFVSLGLIHAIDSKYDTNSFLKQIKELEREKNNYIKQLSFQIESSNSQVKEITSNVLNRQDLPISTNGNLILKINLSQIKKTQLNKQHIGTTRAVISIEENNQNIFSQTVKLSATSFMDDEYYLWEGIFKELEKALNKIFKEEL